MAKTVKKKVDKTSAVKKVQFKTNQKKHRRFIMKECTVKLNRMTDSFISHWLNEPNTYTIDIQIKNHRLVANNVEIPSTSASPSIFDIGIQIKHGNMMVSKSKSIAAEESIRPVKATTTSEKQMVKTLVQLANDSWKEILRKNKQSKIVFKANDIVMAKMRGYSPWPSKIISFTKNLKRAEVYFYGTHNKGTVDVNEIAPFENSYRTIRLQLLRVLTCFKKGILEVELEMNIPIELSITNETNSIRDK